MTRAVASAMLAVAICSGCSPPAPAASRLSHRSSANCPPPSHAIVHIPAGRFVFGAAAGLPDEGPEVETFVDEFWIDAHEVTVGQYGAFVEATGYRTVAERPLDPADYPGLAPELLRPGSAVFRVRRDRPLGTYLDWWEFVPGASWRRPAGRYGATAEANEPATQVAYEDAEAYARWIGGRLPTEAEWERAALGGGAHVRADAGPPPNANTWQGLFPISNSAEDGFAGVAPVMCFQPNGLGLYDMIGNVWEWTSDWYASRHDPQDQENSGGLARFRRSEPIFGASSRVIKGGSYLCAQNYCRRYRAAARSPQDASLGTNHIGFRVVYEAAADRR